MGHFLLEPGQGWVLNYKPSSVHVYLSYFGLDPNIMLFSLNALVTSYNYHGSRQVKAGWVGGFGLMCIINRMGSVQNKPTSGTLRVGCIYRRVRFGAAKMYKGKDLDLALDSINSFLIFNIFYLVCIYLIFLLYTSIIQIILQLVHNVVGCFFLYLV